MISNLSCGLTPFGRVPGFGFMKGAGYKAQGTRQDKTKFSPCAVSRMPLWLLTTGFWILTPGSWLLTP